MKPTVFVVTNILALAIAGAASASTASQREYKRGYADCAAGRYDQDRHGESYKKGCRAAEDKQGGAGGNAAAPAGGSLPAATSAAAKPVSPGNMKAYCRGDVAGLTATKPYYVTTGRVVKAKNGAYSVKATADLGAQGKKPFECEFDAGGNFLHSKSLVDEGKL
jgi:hypothetical protein